VRLKDFLRKLFENREDPNLLREQLEGVGGREREWLELQKMDLNGRNLLTDFEAPEGAAERLAQTVAAPEFWGQMLAQNDKPRSPARRQSKLALNFEVVGHELVGPKEQRPTKNVISPGQTDSKNKPKRKKQRRKPEAKK
jgi:hypothetical protein